MTVDTYSTRTYPNGRVIGYLTCLDAASSAMPLLRSELREEDQEEERRFSETQHDNKSECLCAYPCKHPRYPMTNSNRLDSGCTVTVVP